MQPDLSVLEDWEVGTLIKTVHEARFPEGENDPVVWLSPFVVDLHVAAVTEQHHRRLRRIEQLAAKGEALAHHDERYPESYERFLRWNGRREHEVVKRRLDESWDLRQWFAGLSGDDVRHLLRPFEVDDESVDDLLGYARRRGPYRRDEERSDPQAPPARPYVRELPAIETPDGLRDVYEVAVLVPGEERLSDVELTGRPEAALRRRGVDARAAQDRVQNAHAASLRGLPGWRGVRADEEWSGSQAGELRQR